MAGGTYDGYERECERIREENAAYLETFERSLVDAGLSAKTVRRHIDNVDLYINDFLLRYDANPMPEGTALVSSFLGDYFIRKCMWSTPEAIRQYAASLKKFYKCMLAEGNVDACDYEYLLETIKEEKEDWVEECELYNSGSGDWLW